MTRVLFLDESGDHSLKVIDPAYPVFVLGGVLVDLRYAVGPLDTAVRRFKLDLFDRDDLILRTADIVRARNGFEALKEAVFRAEFRSAMNTLMRDLDYKVIACVIRKDEHRDRYGHWAADPYVYGLEVAAERLCYEGGGWIVAEERGPVLNTRLLAAWAHVQETGTSFVRPDELKRKIMGLALRAKRRNISGLQVADLVVSPIGRHVAGLTDREDWTIVESKFRCKSPGVYDGYGLVELPR